MFQFIGTPQGIERDMVQIKVTPQFFEKYRVKYKAWNNFSWVTVQIQDMPPKWVFVERVLLQIKITPPKLNEHDPIISHGSEVIVTMVVPWSLEFSLFISSGHFCPNLDHAYKERSRPEQCSLHSVPLLPITALTQSHSSSKTQIPPWRSLTSIGTKANLTQSFCQPPPACGMVIWWVTKYYLFLGSLAFLWPPNPQEI